MMLLMLVALLAIPKIFIAHHHTDIEAAIALHDRLEAAGCVVWMDRKNILIGQWPQIIEAAIDSSTHLIWLIGEEQCDYCADEAIRARRKGKDLIPIRLDPTLDRPLITESWNEPAIEELEMWCQKNSTPPPAQCPEMRCAPVINTKQALRLVGVRHH